MEEYFAIFKFECAEYIVKYTCSKNYVSQHDIEDCAGSYYGSSAYDEDNSYEDIIHDIMSSFDGVNYKIINFIYIDMELL